VGLHVLALLLALPVACSAPSPGWKAQEPGAVRGRITLQGAPAERVVVYLTPMDGQRRPAGSARDATVRPRGKSFEPGLVIVPAGRAVRVENDGALYHQIFSYSEANPFELGTLSRGEVRRVVLREPGVVRFYCSLHPREQGVVLVTPTAHFASVEPDGSYAIRGVSPGRYRIDVWGESVEAPPALVTVLAGAATSVEIAARPVERGAVVPASGTE
jgi:plastocyanin